MMNWSDTEKLVVNEVLKQNEDISLSGNKKVNFLVGQCMKATNGSSDPQVIKKLIEERLEELNEI